MEGDQILQYNNGVQIIPYDKEENQSSVEFVRFYQVTQRDIDATDQELIGIQQLTPTAALIGTGGAGPDTSQTTIVFDENLEDTVLCLEGTTVTLNVSAVVINGDTELTYQWEKRESGQTTWTTISGATSLSYTTPTLVFANDYLDSYRCVVTSETAVNSPLISTETTLNVRRLITITSQPTVEPSYASGSNVTFTVGATITSGTINYQWQKREFLVADFQNISGANSSSYSIPNLTASGDNLDSYRCVLTADNADSVITNVLDLIVTGSDLRVIPAVSGVSFWSFIENGPLILDPSNSTTYSVTILEESKNIKIDAWGQGTCGARGGYSAGIVPFVVNSGYTVKLNTGGGLSSGGSAGGGYAGLFTGTTISQATALLIAGGAGGGGANASGSCQFAGGDGGGEEGGDGTDASTNTTAGDRGTQSSGGAGGTSTVSTATVTNSFTTAGTHSISIPSAATNITYEVVGGTGGKGGDTVGGQLAKAGGRGQRITGSLSNIAGQTLSLIVGSPGSNGSSGIEVSGGSGGSGYRTGGTGGKSGPQPTSETIVYSTTSNTTLSIPANATNISFELVGGRGGNGGSSTVLPEGQGFFNNQPGGQGAFGQKLIAYPDASLVAGKTISFFIGKNGDTATGNNGFDFGGPGGTGYNSGGKGGDQFGGETWGTAGSGGGGGGSTAIVINSSPIIIAGGGGGGGGAGASSPGASATTSTLVATDTNYGNGSQGGWGSNSGNGASGGGGGGHGDGYVGGGIGGPDNNSGNHVGGYAGQSGGAFYSTSYFSSGNVVLTTTTQGGYVTVTYTVPATGTADLASGGGGGGSSAITVGGSLIVEAGGGGGSGGAAANNSSGTPISSSSLSTSNNSSNGSNGADACTGFSNSGAGGGGGGNPGGPGGTSPCSGSSNSGGGGTSGGGYRNTTYATSASVSTGTTDARISITYNLPTAGTAGSALQGGAGGYIGGGGGGGYYGGGGGAGNTSPNESGAGGGGSGFIAPVVISGVTSSYANETYPYKGTAGDLNQNSRLVMFRAKITITTQPSLDSIYSVGDSATMSVIATITSGTISYQWQRKPLNGEWQNISDATNNTYTISSIQSSNGLDRYRCILSNEIAMTKYTDEVVLSVSDSDLSISPAVNDKTLWSFFTDGKLILDPSNSTSYTITIVNPELEKIYCKLWGQGGQGSLAGTGGYTYGIIPTAQNNVYSIRLNAGAGGSSGNSGGGYSGIFSSTTINQSNALLIAGGGGGGGTAGSGIGGGTAGSGGNGGASSGADGTDGESGGSGSDNGYGGTQSSGGAGGAASFGNLGTRPYGGTGTALQGGSGGSPSNSYQDAAPLGSGQWYYYGTAYGGGGGGGYFGGGGGGGGGGTTYGGPETEQWASSGGGGGAGFVSSTVISGVTVQYANSASAGLNDPDRGNSGGAGQNSRVVIDQFSEYFVDSSGRILILSALENRDPRTLKKTRGRVLPNTNTCIDDTRWQYWLNLSTAVDNYRLAVTLNDSAVSVIPAANYNIHKLKTANRLTLRTSLTDWQPFIYGYRLAWDENVDDEGVGSDYSGLFWSGSTYYGWAYYSLSSNPPFTSNFVYSLATANWWILPPGVPDFPT